MPNPLRGETPLPGTDYVLRYDVNALCEVEEALGLNLVQLLTKLDADTPPSFTEARALFWAGLRDHHPEIDLKAAGTLLGEVGIRVGVVALGAAMRNGILSENGAEPGKRAASSE